MRLEAGEIVAGRYEIDAMIGSGGMSVVYRAYDKKLDRFVTLKVLKEDYLTDDDLADRFPQEARAAAALNHQNIVSIFDFGQDGDICYIVLEYVDGATLKELITKKAPFDDDIILAVAIQIAQGLAEAHRNGIVHRDIKPHNTLITRTHIVKVTDFGIARVAKSSTLTAGSGSMGSVHYSSPEQARNGYLDHTTDIYSLGVCMYEMATGKLPFDGEMEVSIAMCHLNNKFPDILEINPKVSQSIIKIIAKATEKSSSLRYQKAEDLIADLKRAQTDRSGNFVTEEVLDISKTRIIAPDVSKEKRENARNAFLNEEDYEDYEEDYDDYDEDETGTSSDKAAIFGGVVMALIFAAVAAVLVLLFVVPRLTADGNRTVRVPNLVGMPLAEAETLAESIGFIIYVEGHEYSDHIAENAVASQYPPQNFAGLEAGGQIAVIISLGEADVHVYTMPDFTGFALADAQVQLASLSVEVIIEYLFDEDIEIDAIISQAPGAGTPMREGAEVILQVSLGPDTGQVSTPDLVGQTEAAALQLLSAAMLIPGVSTRQESDTYPAGTIISQDPAPGHMAYRESVVNYVVSDGLPANEPTEPAMEEPAPEANIEANIETNAETNTEEITEAATEPAPIAEAVPEPPTEPATEPATEPPSAENILEEATEEPPTEAAEVAEAAEANQTPQETTRFISIEPWTVPEDTDTVHIIITRQIGNDAPVQVFNDSNVPVSTLPRQVPVSGTDSAIFRIWSVDDDGIETIRGFHPIDFTLEQE